MYLFLFPHLIMVVIKEERSASCVSPLCPSEGWRLFIEGTPILFVVLVHHLGVDLVADTSAELPASCPLMGKVYKPLAICTLPLVVMDGALVTVNWPCPMHCSHLTKFIPEGVSQWQ